MDEKKLLPDASRPIDHNCGSSLPMIWYWTRPIKRKEALASSIFRPEFAAIKS